MADLMLALTAIFGAALLTYARVASPPQATVGALVALVLLAVLRGVAALLLRVVRGVVAVALAAGGLWLLARGGPEHLLLMDVYGLGMLALFGSSFFLMLRTVLS